MASHTSLVDDLRALGPRGDKKFVLELAEHAPDILAEYDINTPLRVCHFWAQCAHETGGFRYTHEVWGPTKAQTKYEFRRDLGNNLPGDGYKFRGRGIFQLTGRANYETYGRKLGVSLVNNPELAARPDIALRVACEYWREKKLNALADKNDIEAITRKINGGYNGLSDRKAKFAIAWDVFADNPDDKPDLPQRSMASSKEGNAAVIAGGAGALAAAQEVIPIIREGGDLLVSLNPILVALLVVVVLAAIAIWYFRKKRMDKETA